MPNFTDLETDVHEDVPESVVPADAPVEPAAISSAVGYGPTNGVERVVDKRGLKVLKDGVFVDADRLPADDQPETVTDADQGK